MNRKAHRKFSTLTNVCIFLLIIGFSLSAWAYERQSSNAAMVRVDVVPVQLTAGQTAKFEIRMNTHSVPLEYDLVAASLLKDGQGREYKPLDWNGSPPGGHHRSGILEFPAVAQGTQTVTLYIKNIAGIPERSFQWKVGK